MAAPICAISLAGPSLSRRAHSEPNNAIGIASDRNGFAVTYWPAASKSIPDSKNALVSSSANKGTPSDLSTIWSQISAGNAF
jgi:hypothetical protein